MEQYLIITGGHDCIATYAMDATEAAKKCMSAWDWLKLRNRLAAMQPGDELNVDAYTSVIRLTGKEIEFK